MAFNSHFVCKTGPHYRHDDIEFWPEDGVIYIEDHRDGSFSVVSCDDFALRAKAMMEEAGRVVFPSDRDYMNGWVTKMRAAYIEGKQQGDPMDPKIAYQKYKERRKVSMVTGMW